MSHIVKGKVDIAYRDKNLLIHALAGVGIVAENAQLYRVGAGFSRERYPLVVIDRNDDKKRIGYRESNGIWEQYQENYGTYGEWTRMAAAKVKDHYMARHYEKELQSEGFEVSIKQHNDGTLELVGNEVAW